MGCVEIAGEYNRPLDPSRFAVMEGMLVLRGGVNFNAGFFLWMGAPAGARPHGQGGQGGAAILREASDPGAY
jgi:hypothetical protein